MKKPVIIICVFCCLFCAIELSAQTVSGTLEKKSFRRGASGKGKIILEIPDDLHVNSSIPDNEFTIPTTVKLTSNGARVTKLKYPKGVDRKFEFSETPINVYEKRVEIDFSFFVPRNFRGKTVQLRALVGYQPCSTEVCYPPKRKTIKLSANVK
jgi:hypothetical protein